MSPPDVLALLAHRYPFLLLDRIVSLDPGRHAVGVKQITGGEWFCQAAAGRLAPMPNGLIVEALAQLSGAVLLDLVEAGEGEDVVGYFLGFTGVRYRGEARAGEALRLEVTLRQFKRGICRTHGEAWVGSRRIVRADLTTVIRTTPRA
jgi:3-hydroxyacyl-[acyl-carrier-protein] dehydratase